MHALKLTNANIIAADGLLRRDISLNEGRVSFDTKTPSAQQLDLTGKYIVPGFMDIHFHGYNLFDFAMGVFDPATGKFDSTPATYNRGLEKLSAQLASFGVTSYYLSTFAIDFETISNSCLLLEEYMRSHENKGAQPLGAFIEGSFINPSMCGAQNPKYVFKPSIETFSKIRGASVIKLVNVASEMEGGIDLIKHLTDRSIIVGTGHTAATGTQLAAAIKAGVKYFVHFLNGPTGHNYKPFDGGAAVETVLQDDSIYVEQIVDGVHINPKYVRDVLCRKGADKIIGVTDAIYVAGSSIKEFNLAGITGQVSEHGDFIRVKDKPNTLCSSVLTMDRAFQNLLNWLTAEMSGIWNRRHGAFSTEDAIIAASKICSTNPNTLMGRSARYGIADNAPADFCVLDITGYAGNYTVTVHKTVVNGKIVYSK